MSRRTVLIIRADGWRGPVSQMPSEAIDVDTVVAVPGAAIGGRRFDSVELVGALDSDRERHWYRQSVETRLRLGTVDHI